MVTHSTNDWYMTHFCCMREIYLCVLDLTYRDTAVFARLFLISSWGHPVIISRLPTCSSFSFSSFSSSWRCVSLSAVSEWPVDVSECTGDVSECTGDVWPVDVCSCDVWSCDVCSGIESVCPLHVSMMGTSDETVMVMDSDDSVVVTVWPLSIINRICNYTHLVWFIYWKLL